MSRAYVVMSYRRSPIFITQQKPKEVFLDRKTAVNRVNELNKKASSNEYFLLPVPLVGGHP